MTVQEKRGTAVCASCGGEVELEGFEGRVTCKGCGLPTDLCTCGSQQEA